MQVREKVFIGGEWLDPSGSERIEVTSPHDGTPLGSTPAATEADIDRAVAAARAAFDEGPWPHLDVAERASALSRLSTILQERAQPLAETISRENGAPISSSLPVQVLSAWMVLDAYVDIAKEYPWSEERAGALGNTVTVRRAPVGVAAGIIPFNFPVFISILKLAPAWLAGCPIILKAAPQTPLDAYLLAEALEAADVPPGVVSVLVATDEASEHLVRHPGVDKVGFTGSTAVGRRIGAIMGERLRPVTLELGGKSAAIVLDDADIDAKLNDLIGSALLNNGQACGAQTRILVSRNRYTEVVDALAQGVSAMSVGDPMDAATLVGPLVDKAQQERVVGSLEVGRAEGARGVTGGGVPADLPPAGCYVEPTVFADADNSMRIAREEIFGPVLTVIPYGTEDEAVAIANDSPYGLCGSVWSADDDHAKEIATRMRTGVVALNSSYIVELRNPFGGFKDSGLGREIGPEGIGPYTEVQSIVGAPNF
ncbi:MAG: aldehyde dehydrogenase [Acidimicrobiia bacterium]|nr:aldehyde dehydrogenase [Acidimicrobiia bacterium]